MYPELRDPRLTCPQYKEDGPDWINKHEKEQGELASLSKDFLVVPSLGSTALKVLGGRALLFDIGASFYNGGNTRKAWGRSGQWFVEQYFLFRQIPH